MNEEMSIARLPHSSYWITVYGEVLDYKKQSMPIVVEDGKKVVELDWVLGKRKYEVAVLVLVAFERVNLPDEFTDEIEPLYHDENEANVNLSNLTYRFRNGPLGHPDYPGYCFIPFYTKYVVNREADVISLYSGERISFYVAPPKKGKKTTNGYKYARLMARTGFSRIAALHRIVCYAFKRYESNVEKLVVNHINGDTTDNTEPNLELVTHQENLHHALSTGLIFKNNVPFLVWNTNNNKINRYMTQKECSDKEGLNYTTISYRLRVKYDKIPNDGLLFKYDDGSEWPKIEGLARADMFDQNSRKILARNVFTGDIVCFSGTLVGEEILGVKAATIYAHIEYNKVIPHQGYNFRYKDENVEWPVHSERHLQIYKDFPITPGDGVIVTDVLTGEETFYTSKQKAGEAHNVLDSAILSYVQNQKLVNGRYRFDLLKVKDKNGPLYQ